MERGGKNDARAAQPPPPPVARRGSAAATPAKAPAPATGKLPARPPAPPATLAAKSSATAATPRETKKVAEAVDRGGAGPSPSEGAQTRRAAGWQAAVGGGAAGPAGAGGPAVRGPVVGPRTGSILTTDGSSLGRRHSVQFSEDTPMTTPSARHAGGGGSGRPQGRETAAFQQNMVDFLGVMYGEGAAGAAEAEPSGGGGGWARASRYRGAANGAQPAPGGAAAAAPAAAANGGGGRGPQLRERATASAPSGRRRQPGSGRSGGDGIDVLVDHLVRAYSSRMGGAGTSGDPLSALGDGEDPVSYHGGGRRKGPVTGRRPANNAAEVSTFVSQALDSVLGPNSSRSGANQLVSTKSILSSLGLDENFANLLSFKTRSNLGPGDVDDDEGTAQLEPMYVGQQAMFQSVGSRPAGASVSKSMSVMRGVIPPPPAEEDGAPPPHRRTAAIAGARGAERSLTSAELTAGPATGRRTVAAAAAAAGPSTAMNPTMSFTLNSAAVLGGDGDGDDDDSWGEVDAKAAALGRADGDKPSAVVGSTRSLLDMAKDRAAVKALFDEEALSRSVVAALEQQLRGYIVAAYKDTKGAARARGRRNSGGTSGPSPAAAVPSPTQRRLANVRPVKQ